MGGEGVKGGNAKGEGERGGVKRDGDRINHKYHDDNFLRRGGGWGGMFHGRERGEGHSG